MADGLLKHLASDKLNVYSAGTHPEPVNKLAARAMKLIGINISQNTSNRITDYIERIEFDFIITVCDNAREICPYFPGQNALRLHQSFDDPAKAKGTEDKQLSVYVRVRDELKCYLIKFISDHLT
ncbi:MAG: protein tyrosine phosphatase [Flavobacteriales bacterium]|nr:protein tyrosine phosphatase [Flavobacteriales bacterium]|tara:strand:- start:321 stop:695 length:375 start_codon:yes stop_codon:yes gene_type:complete